MFWGTGVGGGLILNGKPWIGRGGAGEIGHMVVKLGGRRCTCGRLGCLEAYAGRASMEARARKLQDEGHKTDLFKLMEKHERTRLTSGIWARALEHGDRLAIELIAEAVEALGAGIASAINLLDVEAVVIGGGLGVRFGAPYAERIARAMQPHLFKDDTPPADLRLAALGRHRAVRSAPHCWRRARAGGDQRGPRRLPVAVEAPDSDRIIAPRRHRGGTG